MRGNPACQAYDKRIEIGFVKILPGPHHIHPLRVVADRRRSDQFQPQSLQGILGCDTLTFDQIARRIYLTKTDKTDLYGRKRHPWTS